MAETPRLSRDDAVAELGKRWRPGDHLTLIGPTGRGKSTLMSQLLPHAQHDRIVLLCPKGADPAFAKLGYQTRVWPPKRPWQHQLRDLAGGQPDRHAEGPQIWRVEMDVRKLADFGHLAGVFGRVLDSALARPQNPKDSLAVLLDDSRMITDKAYMGLSQVTVANLLIGRSKNVSIINNYQAPRWVPREGLDQGTQILMWKNRDRDVARRLSEVSDIDLSVFRSAMDGLGYHECLWIDGLHDELFVVGS